MRYFVRIALMMAAVSVLFVSGCAYVNVKTPYDADLNQTTLGPKTGMAQAHSVLWLFAWGDASYAAAAKNGGITTMQHADQEVFTVLFGLYSRWRVVVYGE